jgi:outer membrane protein
MRRGIRHRLDGANAVARRKSVAITGQNGGYRNNRRGGTAAGRLVEWVGRIRGRGIEVASLSSDALRSLRACAIAAAALSGSAAPLGAQTLSDTLVRVYQNNPALNAQRAQLRVTDENVPQALSGYRPQVSAALTAGVQPVKDWFFDGTTQTATLRPRMAGVTLTQPLFNGFKTANSVRQAEAQVRSGREALRNVEQSVFVTAVTAYMNIVADQGLVEAQRANVTFLRELLAATRRRLDAGDVTPTDVAQADARFNRGLSDLNAAEVALAIDQAIYAQVVGSRPGRLAPAEPIDRLLPASREDAVAFGRREHPTVVAASYDVNTAEAAIKVAEAALYPTVSAQGSVSHSEETDTTLSAQRTDQASVIGSATVPLYDGGLAASQVRQAKETLAQTRLVLDQVRLQNDTAVATAWAQNEGAKAAVRAAEAEVRAATVALEGVRREALAGQRTTIDVLNAQQDLMGAKSRLIAAQRDRVVASYAMLAAIGRFDHNRLALATPDYEPQTHYYQVHDAWHGLRTPAGQ